MKPFAAMLLTLLFSGIHTSSYAMSCDDWMDRGGYCVDYIKTRIPAFAIPYRDDMPDLKNTDVSEISEGDVAVFKVKSYWHVAYVEKVHRDQRGEATSIDVSEMNFGGELSFDEFKAKWKSSSEEEWNRALGCGITDGYGEVTSRKEIGIDTVTQVWSPDDAGMEDLRRRPVRMLVEKVRQVISRFKEMTEFDL